MPECNDSEAISASRKRPGIKYVSDRNADSICDTEEELFRMKARYLARYSDGRDRVERTALCLLRGFEDDGFWVDDSDDGVRVCPFICAFCCLCCISFVWPSSDTDKGGVGGKVGMLRASTMR